MFYIVILILLNSCNSVSNVENKLQGLWMINEMKNEKINYMDSLYQNSLTFKKEKGRSYIIIPKTDNYEMEFAHFRVFKEKKINMLTIESVNPVFRRNYEIIFYKDLKNKLLGVKLKSGKLIIDATKFHQDYLIDGLNW